MGPPGDPRYNSNHADTRRLNGRNPGKLSHPSCGGWLRHGNSSVRASDLLTHRSYVSKGFTLPLHFRNALFRWIVRCGLAYGLVCLALFVFQRSLLFFPTHHPARSLLTVWRDRGQSIGYCREVEQPKMVWLMIHGNAGQASDRDYVLGHLSPEDALYVLEYPGYGARPGNPTRNSMNAAAAEAYASLADQFPETPLGVIGESIGSGPACTLVQATRRPAKVVLIVPFDSLANVAARRFFFLPVRWLLRDRWDNVEALRDYTGSVEIYGARQDSVIPCRHARNLARHCQSVQFTEMEGGHNDWGSNPSVRINAFSNGKSNRVTTVQK